MDFHPHCECSQSPCQGAAGRGVFQVMPGVVKRVNPVFGRVVDGFHVLPRIRAGDVMTRVSILRVGARARSFRTAAAAAAFAALQAGTSRIAPRDLALSLLFGNESRIELHDGYDSWLGGKKIWDSSREQRHEAVDAAVTNLIAALDHPSPVTR